MKEGLSHFTDTYLTSFGLLIFFCFFLAVIWWVTRPENKEIYHYTKNLPLETGDHHERD